MENEIKEIIEKNLPAQVGTVLKERLEIAEADARRAKDLERIIQDKDKAIYDLESTISEYRKYDAQWGQLNQREKEITEKERNQKVFEAELKAIEADKRANELQGIVQTVFRSPVYRKSILSSSNYNNNGTTTMYPIGEELRED